MLTYIVRKIYFLQINRIFKLFVLYINCTAMLRIVEYLCTKKVLSIGVALGAARRGRH